MVFFISLANRNTGNTIVSAFSGGAQLEEFAPFYSEFRIQLKNAELANLEGTFQLPSHPDLYIHYLLFDDVCLSTIARVHEHPIATGTVITSALDALQVCLENSDPTVKRIEKHIVDLTLAFQRAILGIDSSTLYNDKGTASVTSVQTKQVVNTHQHDLATNENQTGNVASNGTSFSSRSSTVRCDFAAARLRALERGSKLPTKSIFSETLNGLNNHKGAGSKKEIATSPGNIHSLVAAESKNLEVEVLEELGFQDFDTLRRDSAQESEYLIERKLEKVTNTEVAINEIVEETQGSVSSDEEEVRDVVFDPFSLDESNGSDAEASNMFDPFGITNEAPKSPQTDQKDEESFEPSFNPFGDTETTSEGPLQSQHERITTPLHGTASDLKNSISLDSTATFPIELFLGPAPSSTQSRLCNSESSSESSSKSSCTSISSRSNSVLNNDEEVNSRSNSILDDDEEVNSRSNIVLDDDEVANSTRNSILDDEEQFSSRNNNSSDENTQSAVDDNRAESSSETQTSEKIDLISTPVQANDTFPTIGTNRKITDVHAQSHLSRAEGNNTSASDLYSFQNPRSTAHYPMTPNDRQALTSLQETTMAVTATLGDSKASDQSVSFLPSTNNAKALVPSSHSKRSTISPSNENSHQSPTGRSNFEGGAERPLVLKTLVEEELVFQNGKLSSHVGKVQALVEAKGAASGRVPSVVLFQVGIVEAEQSRVHETKANPELTRTQQGSMYCRMSLKGNVPPKPSTILLYKVNPAPFEPLKVVCQAKADLATKEVLVRVAMIANPLNATELNNLFITVSLKSVCKELGMRNGEQILSVRSSHSGSLNKDMMWYQWHVDRLALNTKVVLQIALKVPNSHQYTAAVSESRTFRVPAQVKFMFIDNLHSRIALQVTPSSNVESMMHHVPLKRTKVLMKYL